MASTHIMCMDVPLHGVRLACVRMSQSDPIGWLLWQRQIVPIYSNITWSDVNVISVWCEMFHVDFGHVVLQPAMMAPGARLLTRL